MEQDELLRLFVEVLERLRLPYLVTGSIATIFYGEPRFTNDIDIVVQLPANRIEELLRELPTEELYVSRETMQRAVRCRGQFNVIHPASGLKVDIIVPSMDPFDESRFARARRVHPSAEYSATFAAPEDVIVKKMQYYAEGGSEKHLRDVAGILRISGPLVDSDYISRWAQRLGLQSIWHLIRERTEPGEPEVR